MMAFNWFDFAFDFNSPTAAPSIADEAGVFVEDCLSPKLLLGEFRRRLC